MGECLDKANFLPYCERLCSQQCGRQLHRYCDIDIIQDRHPTIYAGVATRTRLAGTNPRATSLLLMLIGRP